MEKRQVDNMDAHLALHVFFPSRIGHNTFQMMRSSNTGKAYGAINGWPTWYKRDYATPWQMHTSNGHFPIAFYP